VTLFSSHNDAFFQQHDHPFYGTVDELLITQDLQIEARRTCERILLPRAERWPSHHIAGHLGRSADGMLHAMLGGEAGMYWRSSDLGISWQGEELDTAGPGAFIVLDDDSWLLAVGGGDKPIRILRSSSTPRACH
jgi:hypothetical protein